MSPRALLIILLLLGGMTPAIPQGVKDAARALAEAEAEGARITYRMGPGDTLEGLARAHFVRPDLWRRAQEANRIADVRRIPVGRELALNTAWLNARPIEAEVTAFRGQVTVSRAGTVTPIAIGTRVREGDIIATARNGFVSFTMPDGSLVTMPSASTVRIARLREYTLGGAIDRQFELVSGRAEARVVPMKEPQSRFEVTTPVAVAAVRGTQFRLRFTPEEMRLTQETIEGRVGVTGVRDVERIVHADFGTFATADAGVSTPVPLLPAPSIDQPARVQAGQKVVFRFRPLPGATRYLVELASDAGFVDRFASIETADVVAEFEDVPDGTLFVRASAIDQLGLVGRPGTQSFQRRQIGLVRPQAMDGPETVEGERVDGNSYLFRWQGRTDEATRYRFVLRAAGPGDQRLIDEAGLRAPQITLVNLPDGDYAWQVAVQEVVDGELTETWLPPESLTVGEGGPVKGWAESGAGPAGKAPGSLPALAGGSSGSGGGPGGSGGDTSGGSPVPGWGGTLPETDWSGIGGGGIGGTDPVFGEGDADPFAEQGAAGSTPPSGGAGGSSGGSPALPPPGGWGGSGGGGWGGSGGGGWGGSGGGGVGSGGGGSPGSGPDSPPAPIIPGLPSVPPPGGGGTGGGGFPQVPAPEGPPGMPNMPPDGAVPWYPGMPNVPPPGWGSSEGSGAGIIPEPQAWLMMVTGFGLLGVALRRRARVRGARQA
ncbi:MAG: FecR domain-containing protein [Thermaurantiacus sp.]